MFVNIFCCCCYCCCFVVVIIVVVVLCCCVNVAVLGLVCVSTFLIVVVVVIFAPKGKLQLKGFGKLIQPELISFKGLKRKFEIKDCKILLFLNF